MLSMAGRLPLAVWEAAWAALEKMLLCRTAEGGFVRLRGPTCGAMRTIPFTCKSRLCPCPPEKVHPRWNCGVSRTLIDDLRRGRSPR